MKPASFLLRVTIALLLLAGFYLLMVTAALVLFALPVIFVVGSHHFSMLTLFVFGACWVPALLLLQGILTVRPRAFTPPGPRLDRRDAPELFALIDDLATRARTAPPVDVYLAPTPTLAVTETGGFFGGKRALIVGLPFLDAITAQELRAGVAHELGHFAGGDTRLGGVLAYTAASFASVFESVQRGAFRAGTTHSAIELGFMAAKALGGALTNAYARMYFLVMRASSRRQELAADALAAALAGRATVMRLLEKSSLLFPTYELYLRLEVACAISAGAMPTDLLEGYRAFREALDALPIGARLAEERRAAKTDRFDSHPATAVRLEHLRALPEGQPPAACDEARAAITLLADADKARAWLVDATMARFEPRQVLRRATWGEIPREVYAPRAAERAREVAARLHPLFPESRTVAATFVSVVRAFERGEAARVVATLAPASDAAPIAQRAAIVIDVGGAALGALFEGALLERGGGIDASFGAPSLVVTFQGERVPAFKIATDAMRVDGARAMLRAWAERLAAETISSAQP